MPVYGEVGFDYVSPMMPAVDMGELKRYIDDLVSFGSRFTGYPGCYRAADYIESKFKEFGLQDIGRHSFKVTIPLDEGAYIETSGGERITVYPLFPNRVCPPQTPPGGLKGRLVYVGYGDYSDLDGKDLYGSIVVMEFNSQYRWITAAKLGASAVVFLEPDWTTSVEARMKQLESVAWNFVRVYARGGEARRIRELAERGETVTLVSNMKWRTVESYNVIGYVYGQRRDEYVIVSAQYDSFSWIPSVAPGAREAIGTAIMLQLARYFAKNPGLSKYTLVFIAFSGTNQGVIGSRWFVKDYIEGRWTEWGRKVRLQMEIGIDDDNRYLMPVHVQGWTYGWNEGTAPWLSNFESWLFKTVIPDLATRLGRPQLVSDLLLGRGWIPRDLFGAGGPGHGITYNDFIGAPFRYMNHEPLLVCGGPGMAWANLYGYSVSYWCPSDTPEGINWDNIRFKLEILYPIIYATLNVELSELIGSWSPGPPGMYYPKWVDVSGQIVEYNVNTGWWDIPIKNAIILYGKGGPGGYYNPLQRLIPLYTVSGEDGRVFIPGLIQSERVGGYGIVAYVVDESTGNVVYAPGPGTYWYPTQALSVTAHSAGAGYSPSIIGARNQSFTMFTVFRVGTIVLFDVGDIYYRNGARDNQFRIVVNDFVSHAPPDQWSWNIYIYGGYGVSVASAFVPPDTPIEIIGHTTYTLRYPLMILTNSSDGEPLGSGFRVRAGEQLVVHYTMLRAALDMHRLNMVRAGTLLARGVTPPGYRRTDDMIKAALDALEGRNYSLLEALSNRLIAYERDNYEVLRAATEDTIYAITFFGLTLVPFAIIAERLFVQASGLKRMIASMVSYVAPLAFVWFVHPGFTLASNALMVVVGFLIVVLVMPLLAVVFNAVLSAIRRLRARAIGVHWVEMPRFSVALLGFSTGVSHMRKRRLLTGLTLTAVILVTMGVSMFTSITSIKIVTVEETRIKALYNGILVHQWEYSQGGFEDYAGLGGQNRPQVGERLIAEFRALYGDRVTIVPRAWAWIGYINRGIPLFNRDWKAYKVLITGILGLSYLEPLATGIDKLLLDGVWFTEAMEGMPVAIVGSEIAGDLGVGPGDTIYLSGGLRFQVVGVIDDDRLQQLRDLDNLEITPWDQGRIPGYDGRLMPREIIIVPYRTLLTMFKGWNANVALVAKPGVSMDELFDIARDFYLTTGNIYPIPLYVGFNGVVYTISPRNVVTLFGWQQQMIPVIIAAFVVLGIMASSVEERRREIYILSSVGLSPFHVAFLFLAESVAYSVVGGVIGYILSMILSLSGARIFGPGWQLNYASTTVVLTVAIMMAAILAVTVYPVYRASKVVTPSLERRWRAPPPKGDLWEVPLPFTVTEDEEADGVTAYIYELLMGHTLEDSEVFRIRMPVKLTESKTDKTYVRALEFISDLAPYDLGITQNTRFIDVKELDTGRHSFIVRMERTAGPRGSWITFGREFIDLMRKQVLLWRGMKTVERAEYQRRFKSIKEKISQA
jgi:ABC-type antimicrobial peptide transport system permease subunit